jgi:hypothetical protein
LDRMEQAIARPDTGELKKTMCRRERDYRHGLDTSFPVSSLGLMVPVRIGLRRLPNGAHRRGKLRVIGNFVACPPRVPPESVQ